MRFVDEFVLSRSASTAVVIWLNVELVISIPRLLVLAVVSKSITPVAFEEITSVARALLSISVSVKSLDADTEVPLPETRLLL